MPIRPNTKRTKYCEPSVLMVTGTYHPEVSGAANQCRQLINSLKGRAGFLVLTTARDPNLPPKDQVDGIDVTRMLWGKGFYDYCRAILKFTSFFLSHRKDFQILHLHGFSLKSVLIVLLSKIFNKKIIIKMSSVGHDDPLSIRQRSFINSYFFSKADAYIGINPEFEKLYQKSKMPSGRLNFIPNGVDINHFSPVKNEEEELLRVQLGLPANFKFILFVGHFSWEKGPDLLLNTWKRHVASTFPDTGIVFIGSTNSNHYEVDAELVRDVQHLAQPYINERIFFIEKTHRIEKYFKAAHCFVLPSTREGLPNALLEAMACSLPVIVSSLEGVTGWFVNHGVNGMVVTPGIKRELGDALIQLLQDVDLAAKMGRNARKTIMDRFSIEKVSEAYERLYLDLAI